jgi:hypothetical protein
MGRKIKVILQPVKFRKRNHIAILNPNNTEVDDVVREFENAEWSTGYRFWHLPLTPTTVNEITTALKGVAIVDSFAFKNMKYDDNVEVKERRKRIKTEKPSAEQQEKLKAFGEDFITKGYSEGTIKVYLSMLNVFFGWFKEKTDQEITISDVNRFIEEYIEANKLTINYKRLMTNSLRRYFDFIGRKELSKI